MKFVDLFAGIGGFRLALEQEGHECVFSSEIDKYACQTYKANFGETTAGDIRTIKEEDIPSHDILCAGFPCQSFSISGKQKGFDDIRGTLFYEIIRLANYCKPRFILLENVKNLVRHDGGQTLKTIVRSLMVAGYEVPAVEILNAGDFGCPTKRERIFILAERSNYWWGLPKILNKPIILQDFLDRDVHPKYNIYIKPKEFEYGYEWIARSTKPQKPVRLGYYNKGGQGERIYSTSGHAITFSAYGGGVAAKTGAYLTNQGIRKLTPRECFRVMGFPETFKIPVSDAQAYKQIGNSVAVPVIKEIVKML